MKHSLLLALILSVVSFGFSQKDAFRIVASEGANKIVYANKTITKLQFNMLIKEGSKIIMAKGGYMSLIHRTGKSIELKEAKTYLVNDLITQINSTPESFASKYGSFLMARMAEEDVEDREHTTSVLRDFKKISLFAPKKFEVLSEQPFYLKWKTSTEGQYKIKVTNLFGEVVFEDITSKNFTLLDFKKTRLSTSESYILSVESVSDPEENSQTNFKLAPVMKQKQIEPELRKIKAAINPQSPMSSVALCGFYNQKNLQIYAISSLVEASLLAPNVSDYEKVLEAYMQKID